MISWKKKVYLFYKKYSVWEIYTWLYTVGYKFLLPLSSKSNNLRMLSRWICVWLTVIISDNIRKMTFLFLFCSLPPCRSSDYGSTYTKLNLMPGTTIIVTNFYICPTNKKKVSVFTKSLYSSSLSLKIDKQINNRVL